MARKNSTPLYVAAFLLFLGGVGFLAYTGFAENSVYFLNVSEARAATHDRLAAARIFGTVAPAGIETPSGVMGVTFRLEDKDNAAETLLVDYRGVVPDAFKPGAEVIVEGGMGADGRFSARVLMTKCPSKYQKENRAS